MNISITQAHLERAHNAVGQALEAVADLVESEATPAIGIFPTRPAEEPWRAHHLSGEVGESDDVAVFRFESSTSSFRVQQELRRRQAEREREEAEREKVKRTAREVSR